jgi:hypothetical protein
MLGILGMLLWGRVDYRIGGEGRGEQTFLGATQRVPGSKERGMAKMWGR